MKNSNPVSWFDLYVADLDRGKKFYETVFAIQLTDFPAEWGKQSAFPSDRAGGNISGALVENKELASGASGTVVYFASEDCTTELDQVEQAGGKVIRPKMNIGEFGFVAMIMDTEGNTIGLHSRK
ncbi:lactoylglutathione lyase [Lewinellaceae bacterium SD302]|nr:lactoylglutathione lyase [Lewinellaceae bacterium SD302]